MSRKFLTQILLPNDPQQAMEAATKQYTDARVGAGIPTGSVLMWTTATPPTGWLLCDGATIPVTSDNAALIALVGATTPDLRSRFPVGAGTFSALLGNDGNATESTRDTRHTHGMSSGGVDSGGSHIHAAGGLSNATTGHQIVSNTATGGSAARVFQIGGSGDTNHTHNITGDTGTGGSGHSHTLNGSSGQGSKTGTNAVTPFLALNFIIKV